MIKSLQDDQALLSRLQHQEVDFIIIGGFCGILHGVSLVTRLAAKEAVGREHDMAAVRQLRAIKERLNKRTM